MLLGFFAQRVAPLCPQQVARSRQTDRQVFSLRVIGMCSVLGISSSAASSSSGSAEETLSGKSGGESRSSVQGSTEVSLRS